MDALLSDLRFAARALRRSPGFTLAAVLTLALGIGAGTTVYSAARSLLLRPLPYAAPERLAEVSLSVQGGKVFVSASETLFEAFQRERRVVEGVAGSEARPLAVSAGDGARTAGGVLVSDNYFALLGVRAARGRWPVAADEAAISHPLWMSRFGGDPAVVGRVVRANGHPFRVVGIAPAALTATWVGARPEVWLPLSAAARVTPAAQRGRGGVEMVVRLRPGVTLARAEAALTALTRANRDPALHDFAPDAAVLRAVSPVPWHRRTDVEEALRLLALATGLVLLAACVNVAGILLARATARARDTAVRMSLGAARSRVVRGIVAEALLLTTLGAAAGLLLATWLGRLLVALPWPDAVVVDAAPGRGEVLFALALALGTAAVISVPPVLQTSSADVVPMLKGSRGAARGGRGWLRGTLVSAQLALSVVLLLGAGLFLRALNRAWSIDPGFDARGVLTATLDLGPHGYDDAGATAFFGRLHERALTLPGVAAATVSMSVPFAEASGGMIHATVPGHTPAPGEPPYILFNAVGPEYFRTLRMPVLRGRDLRAGDRRGVALASEATARRFWPGGDGVGRTVDLGGGRLVQIVGVVAEAKLHSLGETPRGLLYLPMTEMPGLPSRTLSVRVRPGHEPTVAAALAAEVRRMDAEVPPPVFRSLRELIGDSLLAQRLGALLVGAFGAAGLLLACVGVYGAMSYAVGQRTREIGVRMALGARAGEVLRMVLRQGVALAAAGLAAGLVASLAATRVVGHLLFGVSATDPLTFAAVSLLLGAATLLAAYVPARRAARVDPMVALRTD